MVIPEVSFGTRTPCAAAPHMDTRASNNAVSQIFMVHRYSMAARSDNRRDDPAPRVGGRCLYIGADRPARGRLVQDPLQLRGARQDWKARREVSAWCPANAAAAVVATNADAVAAHHRVLEAPPDAGREQARRRAEEAPAVDRVAASAASARVPAGFCGMCRGPSWTSRGRRPHPQPRAPRRAQPRFAPTAGRTPPRTPAEGVSAERLGEGEE